MRSTSLRSRTRKQIRTSICERTAPWPMAFWVGRWVAAMRLTATARPRRAIESACLMASGASSASSAYSSMMMISAGMSGDGSQTRWPRSASSAARASRIGDRVGEQGAGFVGRGGQPVDARRPRAELHALLEVDGPDDHVLAGGQVAHEHVEAAALAAAGRAAEQAVPAQEQHAARDGVLERAEVDGLGDRGDRRAGPGDGVGVRVDVEDAQLAPVGQVVGGGVDADGAAERAEAGLDGGDLRDHVADGLAAGQAEPGPPAPHVHHGGHDLRSGQADGAGRSPARLRACARRGPWRGGGGWPTRAARRPR